MKKRVLAVIMGMSMMAAAFAGCGSAGNDSATGKSDAASGSKDEKVYTIGISQFAEHGSLDNCREGFIQGLKEEGFEEGKNLVIKIMQMQIPEQLLRLQTVLYQIKWT